MAKVYSEELRREVNAEREKLGKKLIEEDDDDASTGGGETVERTVSTTDPDSGLFVKGEHERRFGKPFGIDAGGLALPLLFCVKT